MPAVCGSVQRLGSEALGNSRKIELLNIANDIVYHTFRVWNYWKVIVRLIDNDYSSVLDKSGCQLGMTTRFLSNAMPEMHEEGKCNICPLKIFLIAGSLNMVISSKYAINIA